MRTSTACAATSDLIEALYAGPSWAQRLPTQLPPVPAGLQHYLQHYLHHGKAYAAACLCNPHKLTPPQEIARFMSGETHRALAANDPAVDVFIAQLFNQIQSSSPVAVQLAGWDLYHGHLVPYVGPGNLSDLGILFHAKEFPTDYRTSRYSETHPLGHEAMGGDADVRLGSQCCSRDDDFHLRNYIWLMSTNEVWLIDPKAQSFHRRWVPCEEFYTLHEAKLTGSVAATLGDVNYFPQLPDHTVLWSLRESFPPSLLVRHALEQGGESEAQTLIGRMSGPQLQQLLSALTSANVAAQVFREHIEESAHDVVLGYAQQALQTSNEELTANNQAQLDKFVGGAAAVPRDLALTMLKRTESSSGSWSEFRGSNLLQVVSGQHRSDELKAVWGQEDLDLTESVVACHRVAFYPGSTLEALRLLQQEPERTPEDAAQFVVAQKEKLTCALFAAQGLTRQALREAKKALEELPAAEDALEQRSVECAALITKMEELTAQSSVAQATIELPDQVEEAESVQVQVMQMHDELKHIIQTVQSSL